MKKIISSVVVFVGLLLGSQAYAHVGYRNLDNLNPFVASVGYDNSWYQGTQPTLANSHDVRWYSFTLEQDSNVNISVKNAGPGTYPTYNGAGDDTGNTFPVLADLDVGFSLYKGLVPLSAFENAEFEGEPVWPVADGNNGLFNAVGDTTMGNNSGVINTIEFITAVNDNGVGATESLSNIFLLAGVYSLVVGGAAADGIGAGAYGVIASVQPVPVPAAVWLMGSALVGLIGMRKRAIAA